MKKMFLPIALLLIVLSSCSKETMEEEVIDEIRSIHDFTHEDATEILRHNILAEYGGAFRLLKLYHNLVRVDGVPCDTTVESIDLVDESTDKYSLKTEIELMTNCKENTSSYHDRLYFNFHGVSLQTTNSDIFDLQIRIDDSQTIAGNYEDDVYFYSHSLTRGILITKGMSAELEPEADFFGSFSAYEYNDENVKLSREPQASFRIVIRTNEIDEQQNNFPSTTKRYDGDLKLIDNVWTVIFDDGVEIEL